MSEKQEAILPVVPLVPGNEPTGRPLVELTHVEKYFGDLHVLKDINLTVNKGEVLVVVRPSGSGKSTMCRTINRLADKQATITAEGLDALKRVFHTFAFDILGLRQEQSGNAGREEAFGAAIDLLLDLRAKAKAAKDWATSDQIRDRLAALGFEVKDTKEGATWKLNK